MIVKQKTVKQKIRLAVGDSVTIIAGSDKSKTGKITKVDRKTGKIVVAGMNLKAKTVKGRAGAVKKIEMPIHSSNVKLNVSSI